MAAHSPVAGSDTDLIIGDNGNLLTVGWATTGLTVATTETTDTSAATGGIDTIEGNEGDDLILGGVGGDTIHGDDGDDMIVGDNGTLTTLVCDAGRLQSIGAIESELGANGGDDTIYGEDGSDVLVGGAGADKLYGSAGHDLIVGDNGRLLTVDFLSFGNVASMESTDTTDVNGGVDTITGDDGDDLIIGGLQGDSVTGNSGNDVVIGDNGKLTTIVYDASGVKSVGVITTELPNGAKRGWRRLTRFTATRAATSFWAGLGVTRFTVATAWQPTVRWLGAIRI